MMGKEGGLPSLQSCVHAQDALQAVYDFEDISKVSAVSVSWRFDEAQTGQAAAEVRSASSIPSPQM
jgi:hypothetical protein